jgi:peptide/nickel transport system permease protein
VAKYVLGRLPHVVLVVWAVSTAVFVVLRLSGDPVSLFVDESMTAEQVEQLRVDLGFADPLPVQYARFWMNLVRGDFGQSLRARQPAMDLVLARLPATLELAAAGLAFSVVLAVPLGALAAVRRGSALDTLTMVIAIAGQGIPVFVLGVLLVLVFAVLLHWVPTFGRGDVWHLILPAVTAGTFNLARLSRLTRSAFLDVLQTDYVRTARVKGLPERIVFFKHSLKNAGIPIASTIGLTFSTFLGGAVITESIFAWPGIGRLLIDSVLRRDIPVVQASVFVIALLVIAVNLLTDLSYAWLDPRIKLAQPDA